jgi:hydrogenase nickel incorporation protein HypA/HybF
MHEMSLAAEILDTVIEQAKEHAAQKILRVKIKVGEYCAIDPQALAFSFEALARETIAEGADLEVDTLPPMVKCRDCGEEFAFKGLQMVCPSCGGTNGEMAAGDEIIIDQVEVE